MNVFQMLILVFFAVGIFIYLILQSGSWEASSMYARLVLWRELFTVKNMFNILLPCSFFYFSAGAGNTGIISFWDNTYLFMIFSMGIVGTVLVIYSFVMKWRLIKKTENERCAAYILAFLGLSSITTCIFFGRNFIGLAAILIGLFNSYAMMIGMEE